MNYQEVIEKASDFLAMTSLTPSEFYELIPAFEQAFQERMEEYCLDGKPRKGRGYVSYSNSPLPTPEDRLFFIVVYIKTNPLQVVHGQMFRLPQNKANQWIHTVLPVVHIALHMQGDAPLRTWTDLKHFFEQRGEQSPLFVTTEPNGEFLVPKRKLTRRTSPVAFTIFAFAFLPGFHLPNRNNLYSLA